jgi:hypothetical protein
MRSASPCAGGGLSGATTTQSIQLATLDIGALRTRPRKMFDEELRKFGKAARYMISREQTWQTTAANVRAAVGGSSRGVAKEM